MVVWQAKAEQQQKLADAETAKVELQKSFALEKLAMVKESLEKVSRFATAAARLAISTTTLGCRLTPSLMRRGLVG